jgi:hypothetical protein
MKKLMLIACIATLSVNGIFAAQPHLQDDCITSEDAKEFKNQAAQDSDDDNAGISPLFAKLAFVETPQNTTPRNLDAIVEALDEETPTSASSALSPFLSRSKVIAATALIPLAVLIPFITEAFANSYQSGNPSAVLAHDIFSAQDAINGVSNCWFCNAEQARLVRLQLARQYLTMALAAIAATGLGTYVCAKAKVIDGLKKAVTFITKKCNSKSRLTDEQKRQLALLRSPSHLSQLPLPTVGELLQEDNLVAQALKTATYNKIVERKPDAFAIVPVSDKK